MMSPEMSEGRFEALAETYGGEIARWPEGEREAARALLAAQPERLSAVLDAAAHLDRLLDLAPAQSVDAALLGRLIAAAPPAPNTAGRWIAGLGAALGLSAAAFAGVLAGVAVGGHALPVAAPAAATQMANGRVETVTAVDMSNDLQDAIEEPAEL
ncbi:MULTISPECIES: hypothetical protein [unclassified Caulobacter]|uniref:hypothetical protein n=1 Tax=unclassified Caulobacter TaxID=2648921 RepID=UPI0006FD64F2|nr:MULTISPECIES: hypothetical protein [unclassified Caulobacter]KQV56163.1 hypothetical protein ASC62_19925 [Caulobacter sp. Root342]KQV70661.1 hypothetical protein ASC70_03330 [Caulobacter sp. Root343]